MRGLAGERLTEDRPQSAPMSYQIRAATAADIPACIELRGRTRENAVSPQRLAELGITAQTWGGSVASGEMLGLLAWQTSAHGERLAGYCFGDVASGEIVVLALLPEDEGLGLGRQLLLALMQRLREHGHERLFLGCSDDPASRSWGFYRHLGWRPTGRRDALGDEELEYRFSP